MGRIEEIKERVNKEDAIYLYTPNGDEDEAEVTKDVQFLLSRLEIAEEVIKQMRDKSQILASHCAVQMDRGGNVGSNYAFEKSQEIYEKLSEALQQIRS